MISGRRKSAEEHRSSAFFYFPGKGGRGGTGIRKVPSDAGIGRDSFTIQLFPSPILLRFHI